MHIHAAPRHSGPALGRRIVAWVLVSMTMPFLLPACAKTGKGAAREFLEAINRATKRMTAASRDFGAVIESRLEEKADDDDLRAALTALGGVIASAREEADTWKVPETPEGQELLAIYRANLDHRLELLDEYGPRIVEALARGGIGRLERAAAAKKIIEELGKKSDSDAVALRTAQRRYATSMGIFTTK